MPADALRVPYRLILEDGTERTVFVTDESDDLVGPCFSARPEGWRDAAMATTARGVVVKIAASMRSPGKDHSVGLPVVAVLGPGQGLPAFGPDLAALLAASPFIHDDPLLHALRTQLVNGADVVAVVAQALLAYAELRRRALKEAERAVALDAARPAVVTLASLASHRPPCARTPETR